MTKNSQYAFALAILVAGIVIAAMYFSTSTRKPVGGGESVEAAGENEEWKIDVGGVLSPETTTRGRPEFVPGAVHFIDAKTGKERYVVITFFTSAERVK